MFVCGQLYSQFLIPFWCHTASPNPSPFLRHIQSKGNFPSFLDRLPQGLTYQSSPASHQSTPPCSSPKLWTGQSKATQSGLSTESWDYKRGLKVDHKTKTITMKKKKKNFLRPCIRSFVVIIIIIVFYHNYLFVLSLYILIGWLRAKHFIYLTLYLHPLLRSFWP